MSEKTEKPTKRKLREARKKGDVLKSKDLAQTAVITVAVIFLTLSIGSVIAGVEHLFSGWRSSLELLNAADGVEQQVFNVGLNLFAKLVLSLEVVVAATAVVITAVQVRGVFSLDPIKLKAERLSPGSNIKRLFSSRNLLDLVKNLFKITLLVGIGYTIFLAYRHTLFLSVSMTPQQIFALLGRVLLILAVCAVILAWILSAVDYGHQFYEYMKQQKMSKDEVRREHKDSEGDPLIKSHRRMFHRMYATQSVGDTVKGANVVVTNPTHFAVALRYARGTGSLPKVAAKGVDAAAEAIRLAAARHGIPVIEDRMLARRLFATVDTDAFVTSELFGDVARVLALASTSMRPHAGLSAGTSVPLV